MVNYTELAGLPSEEGMIRSLGRLKHNEQI